MFVAFPIYIHSRVGPDLFFLPDAGYPVGLSSMPCRISGFFLPDNRISGPTLIHSFNFSRTSLIGGTSFVCHLAGVLWLVDLLLSGRLMVAWFCPHRGFQFLGRALFRFAVNGFLFENIVVFQHLLLGLEGHKLLVVADPDAGRGTAIVLLLFNIWRKGGRSLSSLLFDPLLDGPGDPALVVQLGQVGGSTAQRQSDPGHERATTAVYDGHKERS